MGDSLIVRAEATGKRVRTNGETMQESPIHLVTIPESGMECLAGAAVACFDAVGSLMQDMHRQRRSRAAGPLGLSASIGHGCSADCCHAGLQEPWCSLFCWKVAVPCGARHLWVPDLA